MITKIITAAAIAAAMLIPAKHALHMFQQNRYELGRLYKWIRESLPTAVNGAIVPLALSLTGFVAGLIFKGTLGWIIQLAILVFMALYLYGTELKKSYIKPLVYTARVKRQIAVMAVLAVLLIIAVMKAPALYAVAAFLGPWLLIWPMALITSPMEAAIRQKYLNEAKAILKDHKDLIKIGITGSFGKTTTKNIMQAMISEQYNSLMTPASYNTPMGITRTIREMLQPIHQVFVCEMGADHVGDITELMEFVQPQIGVVTSVAGTAGLGIAPAYSASKKMQSTYLSALSQQARMEKLPIAFSDIRPGFVATAILNPDMHYPMMISVEKAAGYILRGLSKGRRIIIFDGRFRLLTGLWRCIPRGIWERMTFLRVRGSRP